MQIQSDGLNLKMSIFSHKRTHFAFEKPTRFPRILKIEYNHVEFSENWWFLIYLGIILVCIALFDIASEYEKTNLSTRNGNYRVFYGRALLYNRDL